MFERHQLELRTSSERGHDMTVERLVPLARPQSLFAHLDFDCLIEAIVAARQAKRPVVLMMGGHPIKLGLSRFIVDLIERQLVTHIATNGAAIIHDFELAMSGGTSENVAKWIQRGQFGLWQETSRLNDIIQARKGVRYRFFRTVAAAAGKSFDELYGYDLIDRLKTMDRGDLNANNNAISNKQFAQDWALDATGNWRNFREDDGGAGWDLNQQRATNAVNEITEIAETLGVSWITPVYSKAGNMTTIPKPADPTAAFYATYDAWNRLVAIGEDDGMSGTWKVAEYEYDGVKRRSVKKDYDSGTLDETRHFFYTEPSQWQVVEERVDTSTDANRQFVWGLRYLDDIVERDRDTTDDGTLDERLYGMQDGNWNIDVLVGADGTVLERYAYSVYGVTYAMTADFANWTNSSYNWEVRFAGDSYDIHTGIYHVRNRFLNVELGAWMQRDWTGYSDGPNLYEYCKSNTILFTDPLGTQVPDPVKCMMDLNACRGRVLANLFACIKDCPMSSDLLWLVACLIAAAVICHRNPTPTCMTTANWLCGLAILLLFTTQAVDCVIIGLGEAKNCGEQFHRCMGGGVLI